MTVNEKIEAALSDLVDGNIWPLQCPLEVYPDEWITYQSELDAPEEFGDDQDLEWVHHMQIHWFAKGHVDYYPVRTAFRERLKTAGFTIDGFTYAFETQTSATHETDSKNTHLVCTCSIIEDMDDDEEAE